jgi:hypothetical protein
VADSSISLVVIYLIRCSPVNEEGIQGIAASDLAQNIEYAGWMVSARGSDRKKVFHHVPGVRRSGTQSTTPGYRRNLRVQDLGGIWRMRQSAAGFCSLFELQVNDSLRLDRFHPFNRNFESRSISDSCLI